MDRWIGKTAVVTGASSGIGAAIALRLADAGLNVVGVARRQDRVKNLLPLVKGKGKIIPWKCDVSKAEEILQAFGDIKKQFGGIDVLVNNAGVVREGTFLDPNMDDFKDIMDTNIFGVIACTKEAIKSMDERKVDGHIINMNSILGHSITPSELHLSLYVPSKCAVTVLTDLTRRQFSERKATNKIKVTSISPGLVKTELFHIGNVSLKNVIYQDHPFLKPDDVADCVLFVLSTPPHVNIAELTVRPVGEVF